ncbi:class I glutamine amidotransferase-like superfamily protein dj-1beta [Arctopsyche grandis]|uniref:class I glutamine amidotransferase-like superfamily protein dj-1beta n=1 Tax=Arctopsyche grandis TaxID=121162 RepID=UPI00406D7BFF
MSLLGQVSLSILKREIARSSFLSRNMSRTALVILAAGAEEMEAIISADVLRRAGVQVTIAGLDGPDKVLCSRQVVIVPDMSLQDALAKNSSYDAVILPGGLGGSELLSKSAKVGKLLKEQESSGRIVAAICAAPTALKAHGIGLSKRVTSYPTTKDVMVDGGQYTYVEDQKVVVDGNIVTSRGPGTAFDFALELSKILVGQETADKVANGMILQKN